MLQICVTACNLDKLRADRDEWRGRAERLTARLVFVGLKIPGSISCCYPDAGISLFSPTLAKVRWRRSPVPKSGARLFSASKNSHEPLISFGMTERPSATLSSLTPAFAEFRQGKSAPVLQSVLQRGGA
jgi:hypothetical protein